MMRTIWIIDGSYLYKAAKNKNFAVDYVKLKAKLSELNGGDFSDSFYLNTQSDSQADFHTVLKTSGIRVKLYLLKREEYWCSECTKTSIKMVQKGVDVGIATLMIKLAAQNSYDRVILSAGDGDLEDAIEYVKDSLHKEFWLCGFQGSLSSDLQAYADNVILLDKYSKEISR